MSTKYLHWHGGAMINLKSEVLRLSFSKFDNLDEHLNDGKRFTYLSNFLNNAKSIEELGILNSVMRKVQMYNLKSFIGILMSDRNKIGAIQNSVLIVKNNSDSSSIMLKRSIDYEDESFFKRNNITVVEVQITNRKMTDESINKVNEQLKSTHKSKITYLDDFVGTGTMAFNILRNFENKEKYVVTYYIANQGLSYLKKESINVFYEYIAEVLDEDIVKAFDEIRKENTPKGSEFCLNTAVSEDFRSPNNNHRNLYCENHIESKWFPLLARNSITKRHPLGTKLLSLRYAKQITEEPVIRDELVVLGYDTVKLRENLLAEYFLKSINNGNISGYHFQVIHKRIQAMISIFKMPNEKAMSSKYKDLSSV